MASAIVSGQEETTRNLACFAVAGQTFAIDVGNVREIVRLQTVTPLPNAPRLIDGVIDLRGAVVPVVDLARLLGFGGGRASGAEDAQRIVVIDHGGMVFGLRVDAATDVLSLDARAFDEVPELATQAGYDAVCHVIRRDGEAPVMVLSLETLVGRVQRSPIVSPESRTKESSAC